MRISGKTSATDVNETTGTGRTDTVSGARNKRSSRNQKAAEADEKVAISQRAKEAAKAKEIARKAPDIDEAKVARLKSAIENGTYKPDADKIAEKLIAEHLNTMI